MVPYDNMVVTIDFGINTSPLVQKQALTQEEGKVFKPFVDQSKNKSDHC